MDKLYIKLRRLVASFILVIIAGLNVLLYLSSNLEARILVILILISIIDAICLAVTIFRKKINLKFDITAYSVALTATGAIWGADSMGIPTFIWIAIIVVEIFFATIAVMLYAESSTTKTRDRL